MKGIRRLSKRGPLAGLLVWIAGCSDAGPVRLASFMEHATPPVALAADATDVYWAEIFGDVWRVPKGGGSATLVTSGPRFVTSLIVDATTVYFTVGGGCTALACPLVEGLFSAPKAGGASMALGGGLAAPFSLVENDTNIYFLQSSPNASGYLVTQLSRAGRGLSSLGSRRPIVSNLALDGEGLYWAVVDASGVGASIVKRSLADGSETTLASGWTSWPSAGIALVQPGSQLLTMDASNVYWVSGDASHDQYTILTVSKHGGSVTPLVTRPHSTGFRSAMVVDSAFLYFADAEAFWKVPVGGGPCTQFALSFVTVGGFVEDSGNIYWSDLRLGYIASTPKSP